jgi:predicted transglutaminase-like cysteine proteinase
MGRQMKFLATTAGALLAITLHGGSADAVNIANGSTTASAKTLSQDELGPALPPIGYVRYCIENKAECSSWTGSSETVAMSAERWRSLFRVNTYVNNKIKPVSDLDLYGEVERWTLPQTAGDCEDYALLKQKQLKDLGFPSNSLRLTVVMDENNEGHAVLTVVTAQGDFVLDNRRNDILRSVETKYTFLKRQSAAGPRQWVSLAKQQPRTSGAVAASVLKK